MQVAAGNGLYGDTVGEVGLSDTVEVADRT